LTLVYHDVVVLISHGFPECFNAQGEILDAEPASASFEPESLMVSWDIVLTRG